ncbi:hypothetical protein AiwAL_04860 [Acidiphilium sp. AL]|uniref:HIRAN domain-containing protein n=1 Tax=Acidiphilium iwatense TaxID=768198 RepID=A0ABS9DR99_9PROT|nr:MULTISPECIES: hypothetical protein [Acidiphilium]MCF3945271.1 hypothetical protein [Acidiphilium iwatense]MCU4159434.1 hypothetical protein [Acidiphilium sp. AL]
MKTLRDERRGAMSVDADGLTIWRGGQAHAIPWAKIATITATRADAFLGDVIGVAVEAEGGLTGFASEHDPEWPALVAGIARHLAGSLPYARWALGLVAGHRTSITVYRKGECPDPGDC